MANFVHGFSNIPATLLPHIGAVTAEFGELDNVLNRAIWKLRRTDKTETYFELKTFVTGDGLEVKDAVVKFTDGPTVEDLHETHKNQGFTQRLKKLKKLVRSKLDAAVVDKFDDVYQHLVWINADRNHIVHGALYYFNPRTNKVGMLRMKAGHDVPELIKLDETVLVDLGGRIVQLTMMLHWICDANPYFLTEPLPSPELSPAHRLEQLELGEINDAN